MWCLFKINSTWLLHSPCSSKWEKSPLCWYFSLHVPSPLWKEFWMVGWNAPLELSVKWCWNLFQHGEAFDGVGISIGSCPFTLVLTCVTVCWPLSGALNVLAGTVWSCAIILGVARRVSPWRCDTVPNQPLFILSWCMSDSVTCHGYFDCFAFLFFII